MTRVLAFLYLLVLCVQPSFADCSTQSEMIGAKYTVVVSLADGTDKDTHELVLWRNGQQALHEYPAKKLADLWEHTLNDQLHLVRYFDEFQRAIEYQPGEIPEGRKSGAWSVKRQLVADDVLESMQLVGSEGEGCEKTVTYELEDPGKSIRLEWLEELSLVKALTEQNAGRVIRLQLQKAMTDTAAVKAALTKRSDFQSTDYTDIGDNESDPFLTRMINQGFSGHRHH